MPPSKPAVPRTQILTKTAGPLAFPILDGLYLNYMAEDGSGRPRTIPLTCLEDAASVRLRVWVEFVRAYHRLHRMLEQLLAFQALTVPQFDVLATLHLGEGMTQQELAAQLLVTKGNVCGVLDRLEALGWARRQPDLRDRRVNHLYLTEAGRQKLAAVLPEHHRQLLRLMASLDNEDVAALSRIAMKLDAAADADEATAPRPTAPRATT